jgi:hypothetical protein
MQSVEPTNRTSADFVGTTWRYARGDGVLVAPVLQLLREGVIGGYSHPMERRWAWRGGKLVFLDCDGVVTTIFDCFVPTDASTLERISGHERADPAQARILETTMLPTRPGHAGGNGQVHFLKQPAAPERENLVVLCANEKSLHSQWVQDIESSDRNWDLCVTRYDPVLTPQAGEHEYLVHQPKAPKFVAIHALFDENSPLWNYRYVWLPDDDLMTSWRQVNRLFEVCQRHQLMLAQPALRAGSYVNHLVTRQDERFALRFTKFVEIMCPAFSIEALKICLPTFQGMQNGHGLDHIWPRLLGDIITRFAVIDTVTVTHTRPLGSNYNVKNAVNEGLEMQKLYHAEDSYETGGCLIHAESDLL